MGKETNRGRIQIPVDKNDKEFNEVVRGWSRNKMAAGGVFFRFREILDPVKELTWDFISAGCEYTYANET